MAKAKLKRVQTDAIKNLYILAKTRTANANTKPSTVILSKRLKKRHSLSSYKSARVWMY